MVRAPRRVPLWLFAHADSACGCDRTGGRIKPDVTAPGAPIISASSDSTCDYVDLQGTSMATPIVAGTTALIRQYFMEGNSPYGSFTPSGAMLKATLIHSGSAMQGLTNWPGIAGDVTTIPQSFGPPSIIQVIQVATDSICSDPTRAWTSE
jgi:subtilisin family serine protease